MVQARRISQKAIAIVPVKDSNGLGGVWEYVQGWEGGEMERCGWSQELGDRTYETYCWLPGMWLE